MYFLKEKKIKKGMGILCLFKVVKVAEFLVTLYRFFSYELDLQQL